MTLFPFQQKVLEDTREFNRVAYYLDMGLGKTFVGSEKAMSFGKDILVICQKSKIEDWCNHFTDNYSPKVIVRNLTTTKGFNDWLVRRNVTGMVNVSVINYELAFRRSQLGVMRDFTLVLDESSLIQNETAKRSKFILNELHPDNVVLLSGTPCNGKYENLLSQLHLLGWKISKQLYWNHYIEYRIDMSQGFPLRFVTGYKNVDRLKSKMRSNGCVFLKTDEVMSLPSQILSKVRVESSSEYRKFKKSRYIELKDGTELVGDTILTKMLYERMLCGHLSESKINAFKDLLESTEDRVIVFYNFTDELHRLEDVCRSLGRPMSIVNGFERDLTAYDEFSDSVTLIQYQAGSMGLNLQKANRIIYFTPPLSSELFEQSKKRIHRIGQKSTCFYHMMITKGSIEEKIYKALSMRRDYTEALFEEEDK